MEFFVGAKMLYVKLLCRIMSPFRCTVWIPRLTIFSNLILSPWWVIFNTPFRKPEVAWTESNGVSCVSQATRQNNVSWYIYIYATCTSCTHIYTVFAHDMCPGYILQGCYICVHRYELLHIEYTSCYAYIWQGAIILYNVKPLLHLLKGFCM